MRFLNILCINSFLLFMVMAGSAFSAPKPVFELYDQGKEAIVDYEKYGQFENVGEQAYKYRITDVKKLQDAVGEGIFPNTKSILNDPQYKLFKKQGKLSGNHWLFVNSADSQANFYRWATAAEDPGVKLFYTAIALEKAGHIKHAIKAYYAVVVNFAKSIGWTFWKTPWYVGPAAMDRILALTGEYPEMGIKLVNARISVRNRYDDDVRNDIFVVNPGKLINCSPDEVVEKPVQLDKLKVLEKKTFNGVDLVKYENGHWQMVVDGKPFMVKAVAYQPTKTGQSPDIGTIRDWTSSDENNNGKIDGPYDSWVDENRNNLKDKDEAAVGDFKLMQDMGVNAIRVYHHAFSQNKEVFRKLYQDYGIKVIMGDYLGMYAVGSKADWVPGTDYSDNKHQLNMLESVMQMVVEYKDEPCVLMWMLGNENNYGTANNSNINPKAYYHFVNTVAEKIKEMDPAHPVAICNGDIQFLDIFAQECPKVDIFGANAYRGKWGFGYNNFWLPIKELADRPVLITEYGCCAYGHAVSMEDAQQYQAQYLVKNWLDMQNNRAGEGVGIAIGGSLFEFLDEWWKAGAPPGYPDIVQDVTPSFPLPFVDGWSYEEWLGVVTQGDGTDSPYMRQLRKAYFELGNLWKKAE